MIDASLAATSTAAGLTTTNHDESRGPFCGLNAKRSPFGRVDSVYRALAGHQTQEEWELQPLLRELQTWAMRMSDEFRLRVPELSLSVDWLRCRRLGHFRPGHNGFGLRGEIAINRLHLGSREFWQVLGTLLHELLHAWQQCYGKAGKYNYHNKEFRAKALEYGLIVDARGYTDYAPEGPFRDLLARHGVVVPPVPALPAIDTRLIGSSKLKLWMCGCTRVRVAVADFQAQCLKCGERFERAGLGT